MDFKLQHSFAMEHVLKIRWVTLLAVLIVGAMMIALPVHAQTANKVNGIVVTGPVNMDLQEVKLDPSEIKELERTKPELQKQLKKADSFWDDVITHTKMAIENSDISADVVNQNKNVLDAFNFSVRDRIELSPAYIGGYTLREDSFIPQETFNPFLWLSPYKFHFMVPLKWEPQYPLLLPIQSQQEIDVWRVFKTYHDATHTRKIPFLDFVANQLPVNSDVLLHKLKPGTEVRFHVPLNLLFGASYYVPAGTVAYESTQVGKVLSGEYDVFVFRGKDKMARIRLVANRDRDWQEVYQTGLGDAGMTQYFPNHILENIVFSIFKLDDLAKLQINTADRKDIFLADYTLNLSYPEVRKAYNNLFGKALIFKDHRLNSLVWRVANPFNSKADLRNLLISDLTQLEKIYQQDVTTEPVLNKRRVDRNFLGSDTADGGKADQWHIGLGSLFKISEDTSYRVNELTVDKDTENGDVKRNFYIIPEWYSHRRSAKFFNIFLEDKLRSSFMLYKADSHFSPTEFKLMGFNYNLFESRYGNLADHMVIRHFHNELPPAVFSDLHTFLGEHNLLNMEHLLRGVRVTARYFVNENGLESVEHRFYNSTPSQVFGAILYDLATVVRWDQRLRARPSFGHIGDQRVCVRVLAIDKDFYPEDPALRYCSDLIFIAQHLAAIVNTALTPNVRKAAMDGLIQNNLFREIGPGLMFSLIPPDDYAKSLYVELKFYLPTQVPPVSYFWPHQPNGQPIVNVNLTLIENLLDSVKIMNNQSPDMRLNCNHDSITCRRTQFDGSIRHGEAGSPLDP